MSTQFNDQLHEDLFKLFILASNDRLIPKYSAYQVKDVRYFYRFQFNDRTIADEEFDSYFTERCPGSPFLSRTSMRIVRVNMGKIK